MTQHEDGRRSGRITKGDVCKLMNWLLRYGLDGDTYKLDKHDRQIIDGILAAKPNDKVAFDFRPNETHDLGAIQETVVKCLSNKRINEDERRAVTFYWRMAKDDIEIELKPWLHPYYKDSDEDIRKAGDVLERMTLAIQSLCVGEGDVRSRLEDAILQLVPLREEDFPSRLRCEFRKIMQQSTRYDDSDTDREGIVSRLKEKFPGNAAELDTWGESWKETRLRSTMRRIRRSTGKKIAQDIWHLFEALSIIRETKDEGD